MGRLVHPLSYAMPLHGAETRASGAVLTWRSGAGSPAIERAVPASRGGAVMSGVATHEVGEFLCIGGRASMISYLQLGAIVVGSGQPVRLDLMGSSNEGLRTRWAPASGGLAQIRGLSGREDFDLLLS